MEQTPHNYMSRLSDTCFTGFIKNFKLEIRFGSILDLQTSVDCIVNAANDKLNHLGGLAGSISHLAGPELQLECENYITKYKTLQKNTVFASTSGKLGFKKVLHVAGPIVNSKLSKSHQNDLKDAIFSVLKKTEELNFESIAIPAVSCGIFGFPKKEGAECHIAAFFQYIETANFTSVNKVVFTLINEEEANCFLDAIMEKVEDFEYAQVTELPRKRTNQDLKYCGGCAQLYELEFFNIHDKCSIYCNFCIYRYKIVQCFQCAEIICDTNFDGVVYCRMCKDRKTIDGTNKDFCCKGCNNMCYAHFVPGKPCDYCATVV